jgi:hypothetical protein
MQFRLELHIKPWQQTIRLSERIALMGSCFTEHMAGYLNRYRFRVLENPHGILFNPVSIAKALKQYKQQHVYTKSDLFEQDELWQSWEHHGRFAHSDPKVCINQINDSIKAGSGFLQKTDWLIVTLGSAFVYKLKSDSTYNLTGLTKVVANCHKVPAPHFEHTMLDFDEGREALQNIIETARSLQPGIRIIFTISPVRHYREGLVENNRSKGLLHLLVAEATTSQKNVFYFPSYELVNDDLRDYRFFSEDMVHPNYQATQYVWEKFMNACIDMESLSHFEKIGQLHLAINHRPRHPEGAAHQKFRQKMYSLGKSLSEQLPYLDFKDALNFFKPV